MTNANVKACQPCRSAKTKCDLKRPVCSRCTRLKTRCFGYTADADFIFRNENAVAQRNSERARKQIRHAPVTLAVRTSRSKKIILPSPPSSASSADGNSWSVPDDSVSASGSEQIGGEVQFITIPQHVARPVADRAIDRYFFDWVVRPINEGKPAGALNQIPAFYYSSSENSTLRCSFHAAAYAHLRNEYDGTIPFHIKARQAYGTALGHMKTEIANKTFIHDPRSLAALLLLDNFEILHLGELDADYSHHSEGVRHVLAARGDRQFTSAPDFALWSIASQRLLGRQILRRKMPFDIQIGWMTNLNLARPDLHLMHDSISMGILIARAHSLIHDLTDTKLSEQLRAAHGLVQEILELLDSMETWLSILPDVWKPQQVNGFLADTGSGGQRFLPPNQYGPVASDMDRYQAIWTASMFNFHDTAEIVMREELIGIYELIEVLSDDADPAAIHANVEAQKRKIEEISGNITDQFPMFVQAAANADLKKLQRSKNRSDMAGRFFALFSMWTFEQSKYVPAEYKQVADWIIASVRVDYALP